MKNAAMNRNFGIVDGLSLQGLDVGIGLTKKFASGVGMTSSTLPAYLNVNLGFQPDIVICTATSPAPPRRVTYVNPIPIFGSNLYYFTQLNRGRIRYDYVNETYSAEVGDLTISQNGFSLQWPNINEPIHWIAIKW